MESQDTFLIEAGAEQPEADEGHPLEGAAGAINTSPQPAPARPKRDPILGASVREEEGLTRRPVEPFEASPPGWLVEYAQMARAVAKAVTLPEAVRDKPASILALALAGRELGLGFMESTRTIHIIKGQTALSAELKHALARREGHRFSIVESTETVCTLKNVCCRDHLEVSFTIEEARTAGLVRAGSGWEHYPKDMLYARAITRMIRRHCPQTRGASFRSVEELTDTIPAVEEA